MAAGRAYVEAMADDDLVLGPEDRDLSELDSVSIGEAPEAEARPAPGKGAPTAAGGGASKEDKPSRKRTVRQPRPQLTLATLQDQSRGFNHVFHTFPEVFRKGFKGKGHEVADLQRLLEMYARWQQRIFPYCSFDEFINKLEKFSSDREVKKQMETLRMQLITLLDPEVPAEEPGQPDASQRDTQGPLGVPVPAAAAARWPGVAAAPGAGETAAGGAHAAGAAGGPSYEDEDDELVAMQAEDHMQWDMAMDMMEEMEMQQQPPAPAPAAATAATQPPQREVQQLPGAEPQEQAQQPQAAVPAAAASAQGLEPHAQQVQPGAAADEEDFFDAEMDEEMVRAFHMGAEVPATQQLPTQQLGPQQLQPGGAGGSTEDPSIDAAASTAAPAGGATAAAGGPSGGVAMEVTAAAAATARLEDGLEDEEEGVVLGVHTASQVVRSRVRAVLLDDDDD